MEKALTAEIANYRAHEAHIEILTSSSLNLKAHWALPTGRNSCNDLTEVDLSSLNSKAHWALPTGRDSCNDFTEV